MPGLTPEQLRELPNDTRVALTNAVSMPQEFVTTMFRLSCRWLSQRNSPPALLSFWQTLAKLGESVREVTFECLSGVLHTGNNAHKVAAISVFLCLFRADPVAFVGFLEAHLTLYDNDASPATQLYGKSMQLPAAHVVLEILKVDTEANKLQLMPLVLKSLLFLLLRYHSFSALV